DAVRACVPTLQGLAAASGPHARYVAASRAMPRRRQQSPVVPLRAQKVCWRTLASIRFALLESRSHFIWRWLLRDLANFANEIFRQRQAGQRCPRLKLPVQNIGDMSQLNHL